MRKRHVSEEESQLEDKLRRNRESARRSRMRRKAQNDSLYEKVALLEKKIHELDKENQDLRFQIELLTFFK